MNVIRSASVIDPKCDTCTKRRHCQQLAERTHPGRDRDIWQAAKHYCHVSPLRMASLPGSAATRSRRHCF